MRKSIFRAWVFVVSAGVTPFAGSCAPVYAGEPLVRTELVAPAEPAGGPTSRPSTGPATREVVVKSPWMIREASLPAGFPAVGPVGEIVLKRYPAYRAARVAAGPAAPAAGASDSSMFGKLFDHIQRNDIQMTAPVEMTYADDGTRAVDMAFLYRETSWGRPGTDGPVRVVDLPAVNVVSIAVRGNYSAQNVKDAVGRLREYVRRNGTQWEEAGPPRLLGYNSPFVPSFMRVSEVQLPVRPVGTGG